jgi:DNA-binding SARP family transcriptional activator
MPLTLPFDPVAHGPRWPAEAGRGVQREVEGPAASLRISLFGRMAVEYDGVPIGEHAGVRAQELLCYLLLHRDRPQPREGVASALWGGHCTTRQSRTYLRKALWQLQTELQTDLGPAAALVHADTEWLCLEVDAGLHLDVAALEEAYAQVHDVPAERLDPCAARALQAAAAAYTGDLLEGWYQEWCLIERARLQRIYLLAVDKLMGYCEHVGAHEAGLAYGEQSLRCDPARERTYGQVIRLYAALGDRTGALRAYERCVTALRQELDAAPTAATRALAAAVRQDAPPPEGESPGEGRPPAEGALARRLDHLILLHEQLAEAQQQVRQELDALHRAFGRQRPGDRGGAEA